VLFRTPDPDPGPRSSDTIFDAWDLW